MKTIIILSLLLVLMKPTLTLAGWAEDFQDDFQKHGLDIAVENALEGDIQPQQIMGYMLNSGEISNRAACKALYCAGADRDAVQRAATNLGIPEQELSQALEESVAECGSTLVLDNREETGIIASPSTP